MKIIHLIQADIHSQQELHQILNDLLLINTYCNRFYVFKNKEKRCVSIISTSVFENNQWQREYLLELVGKCQKFPEDMSIEFNKTLRLRI